MTWTMRLVLERIIPVNDQPLLYDIRNWMPQNGAYKILYNHVNRCGVHWRPTDCFSGQCRIDLSVSTTNNRNNATAIVDRYNTIAAAVVISPSDKLHSSQSA